MKRAIKTQKRNSRSASPYLTKRATISASRLAIEKASARAMKVAGCLIKAKDGWIIRETPDGRQERIERIRNYKKHSAKIALD